MSNLDFGIWIWFDIGNLDFEINKYMGDQILRHLVASAITLMCIAAYYAGYVSGGRGWWWTVLGVLIIYGGVYRMVDK